MLKHAHWSKLFKFILIRISYSFVTIFLLLFSLFISLLVTITFFTLKLDANKFFTNFQYYVMVLYGIFLFIFVLMNAIRLFGRQFEDSSFLLLLTRPYSRKTIILSQYLALFLFAFFFVLLNILILLVFGGIFGIFLRTPYIEFFILTVLKLFLFLIFFSILVTTGAVSLLCFASSQTVFLIFIIFCSLFLLGGLPYSLILSETENLQLNFDNNVGPYPVKKIKEAMLFNKYYQEGLVRYPHLTKAIADFYNDLPGSDLIKISSEKTIVKRQEFYYEQGFMLDTPWESKEISGKIINWNSKPEFNNKVVTIKLVFNKYFKNLDEIKEDIKTASDDDRMKAIKKDLCQLYDDYNNEFEIDNFMSLQKGKIPELLEYDLDKSFIQPENEEKQHLTANEWSDAFKYADTFIKFDGALRNKYNDIFNNPVYVLIRCVELYIHDQILMNYIVENNNVKIDETFVKYNNSMNFYQLLNYFNFIEHWNQLWTSFQGYYGDFWFAPLASSSIDFNVQKNTLFSYPDFRLKISNQHIDVTNTNSIQNDLIFMLLYAGLCVFLFLLSTILFMKKNIN